MFYLMGLMTFACIAALTLHEDPNFSDFYESIRTFMKASLGSFDLYQYDELGWLKRFFKVFLHLTFIFYNMILMLALCKTMMSGTIIINGQGTYKYPNGEVYEGEWKDRKRNGRGTNKYPNGEVYEGEWQDDKKNGSFIHT